MTGDIQIAAFILSIAVVTLALIIAVAVDRIAKAIERLREGK